MTSLDCFRCVISTSLWICLLQWVILIWNPHELSSVWRFVIFLPQNLSKASILLLKTSSKHLIHCSKLQKCIHSIAQNFRKASNSLFKTSGKHPFHCSKLEINIHSIAQNLRKACHSLFKTSEKHAFHCSKLKKNIQFIIKTSEKHPFHCSELPNALHALHTEVNQIYVSWFYCIKEEKHKLLHNWKLWFEITVKLPYYGLSN